MYLFKAVSSMRNRPSGFELARARSAGEAQGGLLTSEIVYKKRSRGAGLAFQGKPKLLAQPLSAQGLEHRQHPLRLGGETGRNGLCSSRFPRHSRRRQETFPLHHGDSSHETCSSLALLAESRSPDQLTLLTPWRGGCPEKHRGSSLP